MKQSGCSKLYSEAVYTGLSNGARGIPFPNYSHQGLAIEDGEDPKRGHAALPEKGIKPGFIERMQDAMADCFTETGEIVKERLSLGAEFVLIRLPEVPSEEGGEISLGMECRDNEGALGVQHTMPFPQRCKGGMHVW